MGSVNTIIQNLANSRKVPYILPNGKFMHHLESVTVPGELETELELAGVPGLLQLYRAERANGLINVTQQGFGGSGGGGGGGVFSIIIGDGVTTQFDLDCGFPTNLANINLLDVNGGGIVDAFSVQRSFPTANSIRLSLSPAPGIHSLQVTVFQ